MKKQREKRPRPRWRICGHRRETSFLQADCGETCLDDSATSWKRGEETQKGDMIISSLRTTTGRGGVSCSVASVGANGLLDVPSAHLLEDIQAAKHQACLDKRTCVRAMSNTEKGEAFLPSLEGLLLSFYRKPGSRRANLFQILADSWMEVGWLISQALHKENVRSEFSTSVTKARALMTACCVFRSALGYNVCVFVCLQWEGALRNGGVKNKAAEQTLGMTTDLATPCPTPLSNNNC